jgi:hypothetical protein
MLFPSVPSLRIDFFVNLGMPRNEHFLTRNKGPIPSRFRGIFSKRNSVANPRCVKEFYNMDSFVYQGMYTAGWAEEEEGILHQPLYMYIHLRLPGHLFVYRD